MLAINVFQIVLVENTPETGYLNALALYTVLNTVTPHHDRITCFDSNDEMVMMIITSRRCCSL